MLKTTLLLLALAAIAFPQTAVFPGAVVTDNQLRVARNLVQTTLSSAINSSVTSITVASTVGLPANALVTIDSEVLAVCSAAGTTITIGKSSCPNTDGRGFDGSTAASHNAGAAVSLFVSAWYVNAIDAEVKAIEAALGANLSAVVKLTPQPAGTFLGGPPSGPSVTPTFRTLQSSDIPNNAADTTGRAAGFTGVLAGDVTGTQGATVVSKIGGVSPGPCATLDCSNASNISTGTLSPNRLPTPTTSTLGGIKAINCASQFVNVIATDGSVICGTPTGGGNVLGPGAVTNGFLPQWGNTANTLTTGLPVSVNPASLTVVEANSSGNILPGWMPAYSGDASSSAGATVLTLATVNSGSGLCGDAGHVCQVTTNAKGLVTSQSAIAVSAAAGGSTTQLQYNNSGGLGGIADFTFSSPHTLAMGASGVLDLHAGGSSGFLLPGALATGLVTVTTTSGAVSSVVAPAGAIVGTTDTQTLTNKSIDGSEINSSTVGATFGGTGADLHTSVGIVRAGNPFTVSELSGDVATSGSNVVTVNKVNGVAYPSTVVGNGVAMQTAPLTVTYVAVPNCGDSSHALAFNSGTFTFSCQNITASAASANLDSILAAGGANTISSGDNAQVWNWSLTTSGKSAFTFGEAVAASAPSPIILNVKTLATSTAFPLQVTAGGTANGVRVDTTGQLAKIGTGSINADKFLGNSVIPVNAGGTGDITLTNHGVMLGQGTSTVAVTNAGALDTFLQGQGASADPSFAAINNCGDATHALNYSTTSHAFGCQAITATATAGGIASSVQYNNSGALGGIPDLLFNGVHTVSSTSSLIVDLHTMTASNFFFPANLATGLVLVTNTTGAMSTVTAPAGAIVGTTDTQTLTNKSIDASEINSGTLPIARGGTGQVTANAAFNALSPMTTLGDTIYGAGSGVGTRLAGNTTSTKNFLCQTGTGSVSAAPAWCTIASGDLPSGVVTAVTNDTNVTGSIAGNTLTLGWTGTLAAGRLNSNVVQAITNDTNVTGVISSQNLTLGWSGQLSIARGGTGASTATAAFNNLSPMTTLGDTIYGGTSGTVTRLAGNTTTTRKFLSQTGDSVNSAAPSWQALTAGDIPPVPWSSLANPTTNLSLSMGANTTTFTFGAATGSGPMLTVIDTLNNTGTGPVAVFATQTGSHAFPFLATGSGDVGWYINNAGLLLSNQGGLTFTGGSSSSLSSSPGIIAFGALATTQLKGSSNSSAVNWTMTLPPNAGTANFVLTTDGAGVTSWVSPGAASFGATCNGTVTATAGQSTIHSGCTLGSSIILVFLNGALLQNGTGNDYTISGNDVLMDGTSWPNGLTAGDKLRVIQ